MRKHAAKQVFITLSLLPIIIAHLFFFLLSSCYIKWNKKSFLTVVAVHFYGQRNNARKKNSRKKASLLHN